VERAEEGKMRQVASRKWAFAVFNVQLLWFGVVFEISEMFYKTFASYNLAD